MKDKIKEILNKHLSIINDYDNKKYNGLNNAIIEICEMQKKECAKQFNFEGTHYKILNTKNIAENE